MGFFNKVAGALSFSDRALKKEYKELEAPRKEFVRAVNEFEDLYGKFTKKYYGRLQSLPPKDYVEVLALVSLIKKAQATVFRNYLAFATHMVDAVAVLDQDTFTVRAAYEAEHRKVSDDQVRADMANMLRQTAADFDSGVIATKKELQKSLALIKKLDRKTA